LIIPRAAGIFLYVCNIIILLGKTELFTGRKHRKDILLNLLFIYVTLGFNIEEVLFFCVMQSALKNLKVKFTYNCPAFNFKRKKYECGGEAMTTEIFTHNTI
jgi:hypothetical protein